MRSIHSTAVRFACFALGAALVSAPALAASADYFLKLAGVDGESTDDKHKNEIEILSYSWGVSRAAGKGKVEHEWKVEEGESAPPAPGGVRVAAGDVDGDGRAKPDGDPDRPIVSGSVPNSKFGAVSGVRRNDNLAPVQTAREHDKRTVWVARSAPAQAGAVRVKVKMPWLACRVGARYPALELGGSGKAYVLQGVTVASCGGKGDADDRPTEEVAFYYNKVQVRGWDPKKKEE